MTQPNKTRILYLIGGRRIGGMETHLLRLVPHLRESFVCLVCCLDPSPEYLERLEEQGIEYSVLRCPSLTTPRAILRFIELGRLVDRFRPDIIHGYGFAADILGAFLRMRRSNVRVIGSRRGKDLSRRHQRIRQLTNRWSDKVVCVCSEVAEFVHVTERPAPGLLEVIPNGVPIQPSPLVKQHSNQRAVRFGTLGTVKPIKGTDLLVEGFIKFGTDVEVELVIAGLVDRPWADALRERASTDHRIKFSGRSSQPDAFLAGLDVFVLPSRSEGMSNALLEAMAAGLPCIATDVGSNRSLLNSREAAPGGIICDPTSDSLFNAMSQMAHDAAARQEYGAAAFRIVSELYTTDAMVLRYNRLYQGICAGNRAVERAGRAAIL